MKKHLSTILITLLFLSGLAILLYPTVSNYINSNHQTEAIASYEKRMKEIDNTSYDTIMKAAIEYNKKIIMDQARFAIKETELEKYLHLMGSNGGAIGYIEIPSINVKLPLYLGDNPAVLREGVGTLPGSSLPIGGPGTHAAITGHRGLSSSKLFTNLDKVEKGDIFILHTLNKIMTYQVDQINIVEPKDFTKLEIDPEQDYCTLITCTPYGINSHRMLVRGHRIEKGSESVEGGHITEDATQVDFVLVAFVIAIFIVLLLLIVFTLFIRKKRKHRDK